MKVRLVPVTRGLGEVTAGPGPGRPSDPLPVYDDAWKTEALCRTADPALFVAFEGELAMSALAYCANCSVVADCDALAELHNAHGLPVSGVWGGKVWTTSGRKSAPNAARTKRLAHERAGTKRCGKCAKSKPLVGFHRNRAKEDGVTDWCRDCRNAANRKEAV